jgi:predicted RNase H-like nuclease
MNNKKSGFLGIDGCKGGYVAVYITEEAFEIKVFENIEELCLTYRNSMVMLIDMPIGLPESVEDIRPEIEARKILKSRASCIFNVPCRQALYETDYLKANEMNKLILGKGLSKQSYGIFPKIRDVDQFLSKHPYFKNRLLESHPEICFSMLNCHERTPRVIIENKKTIEGFEKRIALLSKYYIHTEEVSREIYSNKKFKTIRDDIIDALCLAVTGKVSNESNLKKIPDNPSMDIKGLYMQMVYAYGDY